MTARSFAAFFLFIAACQPRKPMEVYNPPPPTPAPAATPAPTPVATAAPPPGIDPGGVLGPAFTPHGLVLPPGWAMPPMPSGLPFPLPGFPPPAASAPPPPPASTVPPPPPPTASDAWPAANGSLEDQVLAEVNARRAVGAMCGAKSFGPAPPLGNHAALRTAARGHSKDMAARNYFDHTNPEGKGPKERIMAAGWLGIGYSGENIAAGNSTASGTVQQWMKSPGHCENIMDKDFKYLGVGYFANPSAKYQHYWTQNFGG